MSPGADAKAQFIRCPHCPQRYGSEESLATHVADHRIKYMHELVKPEHRAKLDPRRHHEELKGILKRAGHPR